MKGEGRERVTKTANDLDRLRIRLKALGMRLYNGNGVFYVLSGSRGVQNIEK